MKNAIALRKLQKGFILNGERLKINGVCMHHDLGCLGAAVNIRAIERQLEILQEMGCNGIRCSHNPPSPELLDLCDRMGFIVMDETFDMVFIDADKRLYSEYYDLVFPMVRPGGLILADNTLWDGKVVEEVHPSDKQTKGILVFNEKVKQDDRVEKVILPLRDGLTMIWKK